MTDEAGFVAVDRLGGIGVLVGAAAADGSPLSPGRRCGRPGVARARRHDRNARSLADRQLPGLRAGRPCRTLRLGLHAAGRWRSGVLLAARRCTAAGDTAFGFWEIDLDGVVETTQSYLRNTPMLVTRHVDAQGNAIEVIDFCPRFKRSGRMYRPVAFARIVRPVSGSPRIRVRLRPARHWGGVARGHDARIEPYPLSGR